ncbi:MAG: hypothetical protein R3258_05910 [Acidimicrobiia bacterium]|nr:hypothetical protein [Acidimicrobiia bacterium]
MRRLLTLSISLTAAILVAAGLSTIAQADLRFESDITWSVELEHGLLHVESDITITNLTPNETREGSVVRFYYDRIAIFVPETVINFRAFRGETQLEHTLEPTDDPEAERVLQATIHLDRRLFYDRSMDLFIEYDVPGDAPRSDSLFRINPAYISFGAYGWGDPGLTTVTVEVPGHFDIEISGGDLAAIESTGQVDVYRVTEIDDPSQFFIYIVGRDDGQLSMVKADVAFADVFVRGWPGDDEWVQSVLEYVEKGLPVLQSLVGLDWAPGTFLQIIESGDVAHSGYGGWYIQGSETIEVTEWASAHIVLHELSHTWFDQDLFKERWITEGLADEFATEAAVRAGLGSEGELREPGPPAPNPEVGVLNRWENLFGVPESQRPDDVEAYESYGYAASYWVIQTLSDEIGLEAMAAVIDAAANNLIAYEGDTDPEPVAPEDDWRRFLDLLEEVGGSTTATSLFEQWVTDEDLTARTTARAQYRQLAADGEGWAPPLYVRRSMSDWSFDEANSRIEEARAVLQAKDSIESNYDQLGLPVPASLELAYESAADAMTGVVSLATAHIEATDRGLQARRDALEPRGFVAGVGLIGVDIEAELEGMLDALAEESLEEAVTEAEGLSLALERAEDEGRTRLALGGAGLLAVLGGATALTLRRREDDPTAL